MLDEPDQKLADEELNRRADELFAEVGGEYSEAKIGLSPQDRR